MCSGITLRNSHAKLPSPAVTLFSALAAVLMVASSGSLAQDITADGNGASEVRYVTSFPTDGLLLDTLDGYDAVALPDCAYLTEVGKPRLPIRTLRIALPPGLTVTNVRGEPLLSVWTTEPQTLSVTHDATLVAGQPAAFSVQVDSGGGPVEAATVCLWKAGDVYEVAQTGATGTATFNFTSASTGPMEVTVTCHDCLPDEGQATVGTAAAVPAGSQAGMVAMMVLMLILAALVLARRQPARMQVETDRQA
ncbi:MAG: hypothetical protein KKB50_06435 [Planctomycetes bacterium]|nr:hypothetical protein [Planctomycetota bacterium]